MRAMKRTVLVAMLAVSAGAALAEEKMLFDFEGDADAACWTPFAREGSKLPGAADPAAKVEQTTEGATSGKHALKITFDGGTWPAVTTTAAPLTENWVAQKFGSLKADVTVPRPCLVGIRVVMENRPREHAYSWAVTKICRPGKNEIVQALGGWWTGMNPGDGKIVAVDVIMYRPHKGESITVDNVRLTTEKAPDPNVLPNRFTVLGTDLVVANVAELSRKLRDQWKPPVEKPLEQVETEFRAQLDELKKTHPKAVLAVFREGDKGFDPAAPDKVYTGWMERHINGHGPDGIFAARAQSTKSYYGTIECFARHRSLLLRVDFSSIPKGARVLAAKFILVRVGAPGPATGERTPFKPNMWVATPCNRPWVDTEVNAFEYARDKFWKTVSGMYAESYEGDDPARQGDAAASPDFFPVYISHGPSIGVVNVWEFADAVAWLTDGKHPNCGFFFHGDSTDYITTFPVDAKDVSKRPALMVIYEPK